MGPAFLPAPQTPAWPTQPRSGPGRAGGLLPGSPCLQPHLTLEMGLDTSHSEVSPPYFLLAKVEFSGPDPQVRKGHMVWWLPEEQKKTVPPPLKTL